MNIAQILLVLGCCFGVVQTISAQGVEELDLRNGFQDIEMLSLASKNKGITFKKNVAHEKVPEAQLHVPVKGYYEQIGSVKIREFEVLSYKDKIFQIRILVSQDPDLYKGLTQLFGKPEYSIRQDHYYWSGEKLKLTYRSHGKKNLEMIYFSHQLKDILEGEKKAEIDDIANDF